MSGRGALRVGTRGSALALWQTERVRALLDEAGQPTERTEIRTTGDMVQDVPLSRIGSAALCTRQIDEAKRAGRLERDRREVDELVARLASVDWPLAADPWAPQPAAPATSRTFGRAHRGPRD